MVGAAAEHAGAPPDELAARRGGVGLALDLPAADARVPLAERPFGRRGAAPRGLVRPLEHGRVLRVVPHAAGLEHDDVRAGLGQDLRGHAAAGAGADDAHVVDLATATDPHARLAGVGRIVDGIPSTR